MPQASKHTHPPTSSVIHVHYADRQRCSGSLHVFGHYGGDIQEQHLVSVWISFVRTFPPVACLDGCRWQGRSAPPAAGTGLCISGLT